MRLGNKDNPFVKTEVEKKQTKVRILEACENLSVRYNRNITISEIVNAALEATKDFEGVFLKHVAKRTSNAKS